LTKVVMLSPDTASSVLERHRANALIATMSGEVFVSFKWQRGAILAA
jgi:hypothetical protein